MEDVSQCIRNDLNMYLDFDRLYLKMGEMFYARVIVYLDTRDGLVANLILHYLGYVHNQILDYEGKSFRCRRYHEANNFYKECPLLEYIII